MSAVSTGPRWSADEIGAAAQLACLIEATAPKPGNVSPGRPFADMCFEDFLFSAVAIGPAMRHAAERSLGDTILVAVQETRRVTPANTNLGIVLLLAPLARAAAFTASGHDLRLALRRALAATTVEDARRTYEAIRFAAPGGLGAAPEEDVSSAPTGSLLDAMRLAAHRDDVAYEYATDYAITFDVGLPALVRLRRAGLGWDDAVVELFLTLLSQRADTLIVRKAGREAAEAVSARANEALDRGGVRTAAGRAAIGRLDDHLRDPDNRLNPGTTADLSAAALFVHLLGRER
jgi:triphosphoribosyl-dephospho-CoA synthase